MNFHFYVFRYTLVTMPREKPRPEPLFIILSRGTSTSELSGPIMMSSMILKKMFLIKDDESTVLNCDIAHVQSLGNIAPWHGVGIDGSIKT